MAGSEPMTYIDWSGREQEDPEMGAMREPPVICRECGEPDDAVYMDDTRDDMIARQVCFTCRFWLDWIERDKVTPAAIVANGTHYVIGPETPRGWARGFGGARFHFVKADGTEIVSTNVWFQGVIPARFRDRMPDTARLVAS